MDNDVHVGAYGNTCGRQCTTCALKELIQQREAKMSTALTQETEGNEIEIEVYLLSKEVSYKVKSRFRPQVTSYIPSLLLPGYRVSVLPQEAPGGPRRHRPPRSWRD